MDFCIGIQGITRIIVFSKISRDRHTVGLMWTLVICPSTFSCPAFHPFKLNTLVFDTYHCLSFTRFHLTPFSCLSTLLRPPHIQPALLFVQQSCDTLMTRQTLHALIIGFLVIHYLIFCCYK